MTLARPLEEHDGVFEHLVPPVGPDGRVQGERDLTVGAQLDLGRHPEMPDDVLNAAPRPPDRAQDLPDHRREHDAGHLGLGRAEQEIGVAAPAAVFAEPAQGLQQQRGLTVTAGGEHEGVDAAPHPPGDRLELDLTIAEARRLDRGAVTKGVFRFHRKLL